MTYQQPGQGFNVPQQPQQPQQQPQVYGQPQVQQVHNPYGQPPQAQQGGYGQAQQGGYGQQGFGSQPQQGPIPGQANANPPGGHSYSYGQHQQQGTQQVYGAGPGVPGPAAAPGYDPQRARQLEDLENQSLVWLIVGGAGFFFSLGFITGPLAWIFGARLRRQYQEMGEEVSGTATAAWVVGIVSTIIYVFAIMAVVLIVMAAIGAAAASS